jgi:hypothetical protein
MFTHHCTSCDKVQLIFLSQVTDMYADGDSTVARFTCWCGTPQQAVVSGAPQGRTPLAA